MFTREFNVMSDLRHDNIVRLYDYGSVGTALYCVMEVCPGGNLMDLMERCGGKLSLDEAGPLVIQALEGLSYAHKKGYVHRDLKPANILLSTQSGGVAKIGSFGFAKNFAKAGMSGMTKTGQAGGTFPYMPHEQLVNFKYLKPVSDVWSMGATLYVALTGQLPRDFRPGQDPIKVVLRQPVVPIRKRDPDIPESVAEVIDHSLQDKENRYQTAEEFRQALVRCCEQTASKDLATEQEKPDDPIDQHPEKTVLDSPASESPPGETVLESNAA
jgi:serine/threonine protein kinase